MGKNAQIVLDFVAAWNGNDLDAIMGFIAADCVYHNIPMAPVKGAEAIRQTLTGFTGMASEIDWVVHHIAESEAAKSGAAVVLTERTDRFLVGGKWVELPVMGVFEIAGGRICAWRDYFDLAQFTGQMPPSGGAGGGGAG